MFLGFLISSGYNMRYVGSIGGAAPLEIDTLRLLLYTHDAGSRIMIYRLNEPSLPVLLSTAPSIGWIVGLKAYGNYLLTASRSDFAIWDVGDPSSPRLLGRIPISLTNPAPIAVYGSYAYVGDSSRLLILDISDPTFPSLVRMMGWTSIIKDVVVVGATLVVLDRDLRFYDLSDPINPIFLSSFPIGLSTTSGAMDNDGNYLYVVSDTLLILDISNPMHPVLLGTFYGGRDVAYRDGFLFTVSNFTFDGFVRALDVSDPTAPRVVGFFDKEDTYYLNVEAFGYIYVGAGSGFGGVDVYEFLLPVGYRETDGLPGSGRISAVYDPTGRFLGRKVPKKRGIYFIRTDRGFKKVIRR